MQKTTRPRTLDTRALIQIQKEVAEKAVLRDRFPHKLKTIAGFDCAFSKGRIFCAGVVLNFPALKPSEIAGTLSTETFPYIPTFLSFRELPAILKTYKKLTTQPDLFLIDGQGIAHPRRAGLAVHVGVSLDIPTIGVAKSPLIGVYKKPMHGVEGLFTGKKQIGWVIKPGKQYKPLFISPGHKISLESSVYMVIRCLKKHKLPEPLRYAHNYATEMRDTYENSKTTRGS
jgi:deoxyribonuclease V